MDYKGTKMTITASDVAATTTAGAAMSMPWWVTYLPEISAFIVAPAGIMIAYLTLATKYNEWRLSRIALSKAEHEVEIEDGLPVE